LHFGDGSGHKAVVELLLQHGATREAQSHRYLEVRMRSFSRSDREGRRCL
jgi:hypothetical protein